MNSTLRKETHEDTKSGYSFEVYGSDPRKEANRLIRQDSFNDDKVKVVQQQMKKLIKNFLVENKDDIEKERATRAGFFQKKSKKTGQIVKQIDTSEDVFFQGVLKKMKAAQITLHQNLSARYQSMVKFWEKNYLFRYSIVDYRRRKTFAQKKHLISRQEKNLIEMENLYGKRQAGFLRGTYMRESRSKYDQWEKRYTILQENIDRDIKVSEEKMFKNSFSYLVHFLYSDDPLSLVTLGKVDEKMNIGYDNIGNRQVFHYLMNALEISDLIVSETSYWLSIVEPYVGSKFQQQHIDTIRQMLDLLLQIFRTRVTYEELLDGLQTENNRVYSIMKKKIILVPEYIDDWYLKSTENQLLEIKMVSLFSSFYHLSGNIEKSYILQAKAYSHNKKVKSFDQALEKYLELFTSYRRIRLILDQFLNYPPIDSSGLMERKSFQKWKACFISDKVRDAYVDIYLKDLESVLSTNQILPVHEVIKIVQSLGNSALKLGKFKEAINYYRTLIMLFEIYYKFQIIQDSKERGSEQKRDRLVRLLELNRKVLNVHNKLAVACCKKGDYQRCYLYIICALFIYNNSLKMIDQSDPLKYPKKNTNDFLMVNDKIDADDSKTSFSKFIQAFNESYKKTLSCYEDLWKFIEHNSSKFKQEFFQAVKDCMDYFNQASSFTKRDFNSYIQSFSMKDQDEAYLRMNFNILTNYQDNYIGNIEPLDIDEFVDLKVQSVLKFIQSTKNSSSQIPSWISKALGKDLDEYRKGKLNKVKVNLYFQFVSMNIDLMAEAVNKMIFKSQDQFTARTQGKLVTTVSSKRSRSFSKPVSADQTPKTRKSALKSLKSHREVPKELLINKLINEESAEELFERIQSDLTTRVSTNMHAVMTAFKQKYSKYAKRNKQLKEDKNTTTGNRNLEGNKQRQRIMREDNNPDHKIGIYMRQFGNVDTYKPLSRPSRFYNENIKLVENMKQELHLAVYRDHLLPFNDSLHRSTSAKTFINGENLHTDLINILHKTRDYYEDLVVRNITKARVTKKLNTFLKMKEMDNEMKSKSSNSRLYPRNLNSKDDNSEKDVSGQRTTVWTIENSIDDLCKLKFLFTVGGISYSEFYEIKFKIDQQRISFVFRFQESEIKYTSCEFCLTLPQELWILKEKLMLNANPELIKTYNPVIYNILLKCFFSSFFSQNAKGISLLQSDVERIENLKRQMGLMYPVEMTRLASYDFDYFHEINMFHQEFTKLDLDNLQALLLVLCYFSRLVRSLRQRSPLGNYHIRRLDMESLVDVNNKTGISLLNSLFVLDFKANILRSQLEDDLFHSYSLNLMIHTEQLITIQGVLTLLERLLVSVETSNVIGKVGKGLESCNSGDIYKSHLKRNVVVDEYGVVNFFDLGLSINRTTLKSDIGQFNSLLNTLNSELKGQLQLDRSQKLLLLFFLILEHSVTLRVEIDSPFRQKWLRGYSLKPPIITTDGEKRGSLKKAILEIAVPKLEPQLDDSLSLTELYYIGHCSCNSASSISKLQAKEHPLFQDLIYRPFSVFQFLMDVCLKDERSPSIARLNDFLVTSIQEEKEATLEKTRCFYMIRRSESNSEIKILYCYRFKYSYLKEATRILAEDLRYKLKKLVTDAQQNVGLYKQTFNNFFRFYDLTIRSSVTFQKRDMAPPPGKDSQREALLLKQKNPVIENVKAIDPRESFFNANFVEAMQHLSKTSNVGIFHQASESLRIIATNAFKDKMVGGKILFLNCPIEDFYDVSLGKPSVSTISLVQVVNFNEAIFCRRAKPC